MDITTQDGLARALEIITGGDDLGPPATSAELKAAEALVGPLPPLLRGLYQITNGFEGADDLGLLPLGSNTPKVEKGAGLTDVWAFYADLIAQDPDGEWEGWIGADVVPFMDLQDGEFLTYRPREPEPYLEDLFDEDEEPLPEDPEDDDVRTHFHDQGRADEVYLPGGLPGWLCWLAGVALARRIEDLIEDEDTEDLLETLSDADVPAEQRTPGALDRLADLLDDFETDDIPADDLVAHANHLFGIENL